MGKKDVKNLLLFSCLLGKMFVWCRNQDRQCSIFIPSTRFEIFKMYLSRRNDCQNSKWCFECFNKRLLSSTEVTCAKVYFMNLTSMHFNMTKADLHITKSTCKNIPFVKRFLKFMLQYIVFKKKIIFFLIISTISFTKNKHPTIFSGSGCHVRILALSHFQTDLIKDRFRRRRGSITTRLFTITKSFFCCINSFSFTSKHFYNFM